MKWTVKRRSRLIDALKETGLSYSNKSFKRSLEANACRVNQRIERFASVVVEPGDLIEFTASSEKEELSFPVLYEDTELLVIDKPAGAVCTDAFFSKALQKSVFLAHRLDKETTGVLLFGKTRRGAEELHKCFEERVVEKEYLALVDGLPKQDSGMISNYLSKKRSFQGQTIWGSAPAGLRAETQWEVISRFKDSSLVLCRPRTGRTHQLRVHLAEMGHPILIDRQYASSFRSRILASRPLLHARTLRFTWKDKIIDIQAPLPNDLAKHLKEGV